MNEWISQSISQSLIQSISESVIQRVHEWMSEKGREGGRKWVNCEWTYMAKDERFNNCWKLSFRAIGWPGLAFKHSTWLSNTSVLLWPAHASVNLSRDKFDSLSIVLKSTSSVSSFCPFRARKASRLINVASFFMYKFASFRFAE